MTPLMPGMDDIAKIRWEDGVPVSARFDDPYYTRADGLAEARHVFLAGNGLAARFRGREDFHIAELGFGTGLNCLAAWMLWRQTGRGVLRYTAFEAYPMTDGERTRALAVWPELEGLSPETAEGLALEVIHGDARLMVPNWTGPADAWFLDGFAPARNPEMWGADLMAEVFRKTRSGGTFATYSAAGHVRRSLQAAGFEVARRPGYGTKREMLTGVKP